MRKSKHISLILLVGLLVLIFAMTFVACDKGNSTPTVPSETPSGDTPSGSGETPSGGGDTQPSTPTKLATPVVNVDDTGLVGWAQIANASGYKIDVNGTVSDYSRQLSLLDGETVKVKAVGDGTNYSDSDWSSPVTYHAPSQPQPQLTQLPTPTAYFDTNGVLHWNEIEHATSYLVHRYSIHWDEETQIGTRIYNPAFNFRVYTNSFTPEDDYINDPIWCYEVEAAGDGVTWTYSGWSVPVSAQRQLTKCATPVVVIDDNGLAEWEHVNGANNYSIVIDDGEEHIEYTWSALLTDGQSIRVKAIGDGQDYSDSDWSETVVYTAPAQPVAQQLDTPVVVVDENGVASWEAIENASGYRYKLSTGEENNTAQLSVMLTDGQSVSVRAVGDGTNYSSSNWSTLVAYHAPAKPKLATPNASFANGLLTWSAVSGAASYKVHWYSVNYSDADIIDSRNWLISTDEVTATSYSVGDSYKTDEWRFEVQAVSNDTAYANSDWSHAVEYSAVAPVVITEVPVVTFANNTGLAMWNAIEGVTGYTVAVYDLQHNYLRGVTLLASETTYQMENHTYILVYVNNWQGNPSEALYYIIKTAKLPTPVIKHLEYTTNGWVVSRINHDEDLPGEIQIKINDGEWLDWGEYYRDDAKTYLHQDDVVYARFKADDLSDYYDSDVSSIEICEHKHDVRYYPYVLPTEQMGGHMAFYKCMDCGAIMDMTEEDYLLLIEQYKVEIAAEEMYISYNTYLNWDIYMQVLQVEWFENDIQAGMAETYMGGKDHLLAMLDMLMNPLEHVEEHEWLYDETGHWDLTYCNSCGEYEISSEVIAHTFENGVCTVCGYSEGAYLPDFTPYGGYQNGDWCEIIVIIEHDGALLDPPQSPDDYFVVIPQKSNLFLTSGFAYSETKREREGGTEDGKLNERQYYRADTSLMFGLGNRTDMIQAVVISRKGVVKYLNMTGTNPFGEPNINSIYINEGQEIAVGVTAPIQYTMDCSDFYWFVDRELVWTSSDESVLTIDSAGNMTAHKAGTVLVSVEVPRNRTGIILPNLFWDYFYTKSLSTAWRGFTIFSEITVKDEILPTSIDTRENVTVTNKNPYQIEVSFAPRTSFAMLSFESSNDSVATVDANGLVTAMSEGNADITVTSSNGLTKVVHVTVECYDIIDKTPLAYDYTDYFDNYAYGNNTPLEGEINLLVLPVYFADSCPYYDYDLIRHDLEIAFFGTKEFNGFDTVKSYYETESRGALSINGVVGDWFYFPHSVASLSADYTAAWDGYYSFQSLASQAVNCYREVNTVDGIAPSLKEYDNDGDGYLDGVVIIYAYPDREKQGDLTHNDLLWAEVKHYNSASSGDVNNPVLSKTFMIASFDFMYGDYNASVTNDGTQWWDYGRESDCYYLDSHPVYEEHDDDPNYYDNVVYDSIYDDPEFYLSYTGYGHDFHKYVDTTYYIHEMAHMFGIFDYYDLGMHDGSSIVFSDLDGGFNMQDRQIGTHDPYSTMAFGWVDPYIITDNCTIEINPSTTSGDVILLPIAGHDVNSPFDEYLLIELFTPDGLNEFYTTYKYYNAWIGPNIAGCRVWHVDSRIVDNLGNLIEGGVIDGSKLVKHATSNTYGDGANGYKQYYQLMLIRKNADVDDDAFYVQHEIDGGASENELVDRPDNIYESFLTADNLFVTGDTFDMTRYAKAFYNEGLMDSGEELGWEISFDYVDGERAIITFTKTV